MKLEGANPTGSYKDRMALAMIRGAERAGRLESGQPVVEHGGSTGSCSLPSSAPSPATRCTSSRPTPSPRRSGRRWRRSAVAGCRTRGLCRHCATSPWSRPSRRLLSGEPGRVDASASRAAGLAALRPALLGAQHVDPSRRGRLHRPDATRRSSPPGGPDRGPVLGAIDRCQPRRRAGRRPASRSRSHRRHGPGRLRAQVPRRRPLPDLTTVRATATVVASRPTKPPAASRNSASAARPVPPSSCSCATASPSRWCPGTRSRWSTGTATPPWPPRAEAQAERGRRPPGPPRDRRHLRHDAAADRTRRRRRWPPGSAIDADRRARPARGPPRRVGGRAVPPADGRGPSDRACR